MHTANSYSIRRNAQTTNQEHKQNTPIYITTTAHLFFSRINVTVLISLSLLHRSLNQVVQSTVGADRVASSNNDEVRRWRCAIQHGTSTYTSSCSLSLSLSLLLPVCPSDILDRNMIHVTNQKWNLAMMRFLTCKFPLMVTDVIHRFK